MKSILEHLILFMLLRIDLMFDPESLKTRADLISHADLSPEALLEGECPEDFELRLLSLFKTHNVDHSGEMDMDQFFNCIDSLNLNLTRNEIMALISVADVNHSGTLRYDAL